MYLATGGALAVPLPRSGLGLYLGTSQQRLAKSFPPNVAGLGDAMTDYLAQQAKTKQTISTAGAYGGSLATAAVGTIAAHLAATGGSVIGLSAGALSAAVPFIGPAIMGATLLIQHLIANSGCGITCIETSQWANEAEPALAKNLDGYFSLPTPRTQTQKALALANFDSIWGQLVSMCSDPSTGDAGKRCISDRQAGACKWKQTASNTVPGSPAVGQCWNWFAGYRDPIANDPVVPDPVPDTSAGGGDGSTLYIPGSAGGGSNLLPLLLVGGLIAAAVAL